MRGMRMIYKIAAHSDVGIVKKTNQDSVLVKIAQTNHDKVCLCVVCDGMGGLADGELASATVIREFDQWFINKLLSTEIFFTIRYSSSISGLSTSFPDCWKHRNFQWMNFVYSGTTW